MKEGARNLCTTSLYREDWAAGVLRAYMVRSTSRTVSKANMTNCPIFPSFFSNLEAEWLVVFLAIIRL